MNRKSGTKFVRHQNVGRDDIVLYDVRVQAVRLLETDTTPATGAIQISLESLKLLAELDSRFKLPKDPPASHSATNGAGSSSQESKKSKRVVVGMARSTY